MAIFESNYGGEEFNPAVFQGSIEAYSAAVVDDAVTQAMDGEVAEHLMGAVWNMPTVELSVVGARQTHDTVSEPQMLGSAGLTALDVHFDDLSMFRNPESRDNDEPLLTFQQVVDAHLDQRFQDQNAAEERQQPED